MSKRSNLDRGKDCVERLFLTSAVILIASNNNSVGAGNETYILREMASLAGYDDVLAFFTENDDVGIWEARPLYDKGCLIKNLIV